MGDETLPESALLTKTLRRYVEDPDATDEDGDDVFEDDDKLRYRVRKRVRSIVAEFSRLREEWPLSEVSTTFRDPDEVLLGGMRDVIALFYMALGQREFEQLVGDGVYRGEQRQGRTNVINVDCELNFRRSEPTTNVDQLKRIWDEGHRELSREEIGILVTSGELSAEELDELAGLR